jgi:hypothetical protein
MQGQWNGSAHTEQEEREHQVNPGNSGNPGLYTCAGGGVCAWYIQAGKMPKAMLPDKTIASMAKPRNASKLLLRWFILLNGQSLLL